MALKHQIILAPAVVLCLMTLLLAFLQFTYWDLSVKRQQAKDLKTAFIAIAESDLATQRMNAIIRFIEQHPTTDPQLVEQLAELQAHLGYTIARLEESSYIPPATLELINRAVSDLNPEQGIEIQRYDEALALLRPQLKTQLEALDKKRSELSDIHREDIDELVAQTTFVAIVVLGVAILLGIVLSLTFARRILKRIHILSDSAERITKGDFAPPPAPAVIQDELDGLAVSINRMTDQLIRVVAAEKLLEGAEEERRRIAMDIHDQTLADLSDVRRGLERLAVDASCKEPADVIASDLSRAITNLRVVMDNLHPQTLDILGLPAAIESHLEKVCDGPDSPEYHFMASDALNQLTLSKLTQVTLYRVIVEAVHNVLRHAKASILEVNLVRAGKQLVVAVEDNGRGFNFTPSLPGTSGGHGLHNIQERARAIGAQVSWGPSRFTTGTRFELILPISP